MISLYRAILTMFSADTTRIQTSPTAAQVQFSNGYTMKVPSMITIVYHDYTMKVHLRSHKEILITLLSPATARIRILFLSPSPVDARPMLMFDLDCRALDGVSRTLAETTGTFIDMVMGMLLSTQQIATIKPRCDFWVNVTSRDIVMDVMENIIMFAWDDFNHDDTAGANEARRNTLRLNAQTNVYNSSFEASSGADALQALRKQNATWRYFPTNVVTGADGTRRLTRIYDESALYNWHRGRRNPVDPHAEDRSKVVNPAVVAQYVIANTGSSSGGGGRRKPTKKATSKKKKP
jgi:hypothetical protein